MTQAERITALETQMAYLVAELRETNERQKQTNARLEDLLALRNKGLGAFWLATTLFGTSLIGIATVFMSWLKG